MHRGRFFLAYVGLALFLAAVYGAFFFSGNIALGGHRAAQSPRPKAKEAKLLATMVAERFLGALTIPVDYRRACAEVEFEATCLHDWPRMKVAVRTFELQGVEVFPTIVEVGVKMDGITGVLELKWHGGDFKISNLVQD